MSDNADTLTPLVNVPASGLQQVYQSDNTNRFDVSLSGPSSNLSFNRYQDALGQNQSHVMTIARATGNVGIGTTLPTYPLDISGGMRIGDPNLASYLINLGRTGVGTDRSAYIFGDGTNMRIANQQNGQIRFDTNNIQRMFIDSNGNVGIGSVGVTDKFEVWGTGSARFIINGATTSGYAGRIDVTDEGVNFSSVTNSARPIRFMLGSPAVERMRITQLGNVGIGTTNPTSALHIERTNPSLPADVSTLRSVLTPNSTSGTAVSSMQWGWYTNTFDISAIRGGSSNILRTDFIFGSTSRMSLTSGGDVGIGTTSPNSRLHVYHLISSDSFADGINVGPGNNNVGGIWFVNGNGAPATKYMAINTIRANNNGSSSEYGPVVMANLGGNVGVGTTAPAAKLHVVGEGRFGVINLWTSDYKPDGQPWYGFLREPTNIVRYNGFAGHAFSTSGGEALRINASGNVGIGTESPAGRLHIEGERAVFSTNSSSNMRLDLYNNSISSGAGFETRYARGTMESPTQTLNEHVIFGIYSRAYNDAGAFSTNNIAAIRFVATQNHTNSAAGTRIDLATTPNGGISRTTRMVINHDGNVGIGSITPADKLHVTGNVRIGVNANDYHYLRMGGGNSHGYLFGSFPGLADGITLAYNHYYDSSGSIQYFNTGAGANNASLSVQYGSIVMRTGTNNTPPTTRLTINSSGNVGIGTTIPRGKLHVHQSDILLSRDSFNTESMSLTFGSGSTQKMGIITSPAGDFARGSLHICTNNEQNNNNVSLSDSRMVITNTGNVGIGTSDPGTFRLSVNGSALIAGSVDMGVGNNSVFFREQGGNPALWFGTPGNDSAPNHAKLQLANSYNDLLVQSSRDIIFRRNTDNIVIMKQGGNVGIGMTTPGSRLRVDGNPSTLTDKAVVRIQGAATGSDAIEQGQSLLLLVDQSAATGNRKGIAFARDTDAKIVAGIQHSILSGGGGNLDFYTSLAGQDNNVSMSMRIAGSGNVGIGTTLPRTTHHINSVTSVLDATRGLRLGDATDFAYFNYIKPGGSNIEYLSIQAVQDGNSTRRNIVLNPQSGNIGIGITNPSQRLTVNGNILVTGNITPSANEVYDIGSSTSRFRDIFLSGNSVHLGGAVISFNSATGQVEFRDEITNNLLNLSAENTGNISSESGNTIFSEGNVGIGLSDPADKLHVLGAIRFGDSALAAHQARVFSGSTFSGWQTQNGTNAISVQQSNGHVGIGTTNPGSSRLFVSGTLGTSSNLSFTSNSSTVIVGPSGTTGAPRRNFLNIISETNTERILRIRRGGNNPTHAGLMLSNFDADNYLFRTADAGMLCLDHLNASQFETHGEFGTSILRISNGGNVGIGTANAQGRLHIANNQGGNFGNLILDANISSGYTGRIDLTNSGFDFSAISDSRAIRFLTGVTPIERVRISPAGNLGIGTNSPIKRLHSHNNVANGDSGVVFSNLDTGESGGLHIGYHSGRAYIYNVTNSPMTFHTNNTEQLRINQSGNVGIGTTNPTSRLMVVDDSQAALRIASFNGQPIGNNSWNSGDVFGQIQFGGVGNMGGFQQYPASIVALADSNITTGGSVNQDVSGRLEFRTFPSTSGLTSDQAIPVTRMTIKNNGNVGIGTTNPLTRLWIKKNPIPHPFVESDYNGVEATVGIIGEPILSRNTSTPQRLLYLHQPNHDGFSKGSSFGISLAFRENPGSDQPRTRVDFQLPDFISNSVVPSRNVISLTDIGRVGIGTTSPSQILDVNGNINFTGSLLQNGVAFSTGTSSQWTTNGNDIHYTAGNVGIGTVSPTGRLDVRGNLSIPFNMNLANAQGIIINGSSQAYTRIFTSYYDQSALIDILDLQPAGSSNSAIVFRSGAGSNGNRNERMRIDTAGNVGIGTISPRDRLHILGGNARIESNHNDYALYLHGTGGSGGVQGRTLINFHHFGVGSIIGNSQEIPFSEATPTAQIGLEQQNTTGWLGNIIFRTKSVSAKDGAVLERMRITHSGDVGIGTTNPLTSLHVSNQATLADLLSNPISKAQTLLTSGSHRTYIGSFRTLGSFTASVIQSSDFFNSIDNYTRLLINPRGGNVGIGTTGPQDTLHLDGTLRIENYNNLTTDGAFFRTYYGRGSSSSPGQVLEGNTVSGWFSRSYGVGVGTVPAGFQSTASTAIKFEANEDQTVTAGGSRIALETAPNGTLSRSARMVFSANELLLRAPSNQTIVLRGTHASAFNSNTGDITLYEAGTANMIIKTSANMIFRGLTGTAPNQMEIERMRINANGDVGIGTNNPGSKLDIFNELSSTIDKNSIGTINIQGPSLITGDQTSYVNQGQSITFRANTVPRYTGTIQETVSAIRSSYDTSGSDILSGSHSLGFWTYRGWGSTGGGSLEERMRITSAGNVGIGTTAPGAILHIDGGLKPADQFTTVNASDSKILFYGSGGSTGNWAGMGVDTGGNWWVRNGINTQNILYMRSTSGNVGIGVTNPSERLHVNGAVRSTTTAKAWVNFNGSLTTPSVRASYNVSSVTRISTGRYRINYTTALTTANYAISGMAQRTQSSPDIGNGDFKISVLSGTNPPSNRMTTTFVEVETGPNSVTLAEDAFMASVIVYHN